MLNQKLIKWLTVGTVGIGGWFGGSLYEKYKYGSFGEIFNVFAATPMIISEDSPETKIGHSTRTAEIMRFGFPSFDQLRSQDDYVLSYDRRNRVANWVFEHLTRANLQIKDGVDRTKCYFTEDPSIHPFFRSTNDDYKSSGYDRGHLAAAGNHRLSQKHCDQTFLLSNMTPQVGHGFNRDAWNKLEKYVRHLTKYYPNVYVCSGPLYIPRRESDGKMYVKYEVIGANNVAVPTHFFKVILCETDKRQLELEAYVMPNAVIDERIPIHSFQVPVESIERAAGLLFYDKIPRERFKRLNGRKVAFG